LHILFLIISRYSNRENPFSHLYAYFSKKAAEAFFAFAELYPLFMKKEETPLLG